MGDSIQILERMVKQAAVRHATLASNIANADTPGYRAKDVKFAAELESQSAVLATTSPAHIKTGGGGSGGAADVEVVDAKSWADGNTVELDQEVAKMTENGMVFQAGIKMLNSKFRMLRNAIKTR